MKMTDPATSPMRSLEQENAPEPPLRTSLCSSGRCPISAAFACLPFGTRSGTGDRGCCCGVTKLGKGCACCAKTRNFLITAFTIVFNLLAIPFMLVLSLQRFLMRDCNWRLALREGDDTYFDGKTIWITGASSGIGRCLAVRAIKNGGRIIISGRRVDALNETKRLAAQGLREGADVDEYIHIVAFKFEGLDAEGLIAEAEKAWSWRGEIDIFFNNAGMGLRGTLSDASVDFEVLHNTFVAPAILAKWFVCKKTNYEQGERAASAGAPQEVHAALVTTCSVVSRLTPGRCAYSGAKAGIMQYAEDLRLELMINGFSNFRVTNVLPGPVATEFSLKALTPTGEAFGKMDSFLANGMTADRCAELTMRATSANEREAWVTGQPQLTLMYLTYYCPFLVKELLGTVNACCMKKLFKLFGTPAPAQVREIVCAPPPAAAAAVPPVEEKKEL